MAEKSKISWQRTIAFSLILSMWVTMFGALTAQAQDKDKKTRKIRSARVPTQAVKTPQIDNTVRSASPNSPAVVFTNSTAISIPEEGGAASPYSSNITVSGLTGTITDLNVRINNFSHGWPRDVAILLVSPGGRKFILQSDVGGTTPVSNITYTLDDQATEVITRPGPFPANNTSVRPSSVGDDDEMDPPAPPEPYNQPAPAGTATLNGTFGGIDPNGVWQLFVYDFFEDDGGSIAGGWSLDITVGGGEPQAARPCFDFFGSGRTSFATVGAAQTGEIIWRLLNNGGTGSDMVFFGSAETDFLTPGYYDNDDIADVAVWRPGAPAATYYVRPSTAPTTFYGQQWGQHNGLTGDISGLEADYDNDGRDDYTVVRAEGSIGVWYILGSQTNTLRAIRFGDPDSDLPLPGADYTGDGRADLAVLRRGTGADTYLIGDSNTGALVLAQPWGEFNTDFYVIGDYLGDSRADFAVWRGAGSGTNGRWYILENGGSGQIAAYQFGIPGTPGVRDTPICGDYNGDGKSDVAVYRPSNNTFYWLNSVSSGDPTTFGSQQFGQPGDFPVGGLKAF